MQENPNPDVKIIQINDAVLLSAAEVRERLRLPTFSPVAVQSVAVSSHQ
jgi:hypothetical protein